MKTLFKRALSSRLISRAIDIAAVHKLTPSMSDASPIGLEIERKWHFCGTPALLKELKDSALEVEYLRQWCIQKPLEKTMVRFRNFYSDIAATPNTHMETEVTMKLGKGMVRKELNADVAGYYEPVANNIHKTRYHFVLENGMKAVMDVYHGANHGLVHIEIEFKSKAEALAFEAPLGFGKDVTTELSHTNMSLHSNPYRAWFD